MKILLTLLTVIIAGCATTPTSDLHLWDQSKSDTFANRMDYRGIWCGAFHWCDWENSGTPKEGVENIKRVDATGRPNKNGNNGYASFPRR